MKLAVLFCLILLWTTEVFASVIGIDFGSDYIKVAGPHNGNNVDIVLNEQSHRKTDNYIGFRGSERYIGDQAKSLAARFPLNMVTMVNQLIGVMYDSSDFQDFKKLECEFETRKEKRDTLGFSFGSQVGDYTVEELFAMLIQYARDISNNDGIIDPKSLVITIPFHSSLGKRQAVLEAARLVDLNVLGLMHSTTAAALYYGVRRRGFENKTLNLLVYDIGSTHTEVGVYRFSPPIVQPGKKSKIADSFGTLTTLSVVDDTILGGRAFDLCLARLIETEAMEKMKIQNIIGGTTIAQRKSQFSLLRAAKKAKEVLSANTNTPITVEGIVPEKDFNTQMSRKDFEKKCSHLFDRIPKVAEEAITKSGLSLKEIDAFEMMGGASRTPKIIADLSAFIGREVDRTLNADEAAAIGAAYYALRLSSLYRVRSFTVKEHIPFVISLRITPSLGSNNGIKRLLVENPEIGTRKSITLNRTDDFTLQLFDSKNDDPIGEIAIQGVKSALDSLGLFTPSIIHPNNSHIIRVQLCLSESGLFEVEEAEAIYRFAVNVSRKIKLNETSEDSNSSSTEDYRTEYLIKMKKRSKRLTTLINYAFPKSMSDEEFKKSKSKIEKISEEERLKREAAVAKNNLETFLFWVKSEGVLENETALSLLNAERVQEINTKLSEIRDWLEDGEGAYETCTMEEYKAKLDELEKLVRPNPATVSENNSEDDIKGDL